MELVFISLIYGFLELVLIFDNVNLKFGYQKHEHRVNASNSLKLQLVRCWFSIPSLLKLWENNRPHMTLLIIENTWPLATRVFVGIDELGTYPEVNPLDLNIDCVLGLSQLCTTLFSFPFLTEGRKHLFLSSSK